jgi:hypothetical protein
MSGRKSVLLSLLAGVVTATLALVALVAFLPGPARPIDPAPSAAPTVMPSPPTAEPSRPAGPSRPVEPSASGGPSASAVPSAVPSAGPRVPAASPPSASASPAVAAFGVGLPAPALRVPTLGDGTIALALPVHLWVDRGGVVRAGALGGIGAGVMARNLGTILPGVAVTP